jgi:outer membrane protein OmpA-like peptidoglycan-associated protein
MEPIGIFILAMICQVYSCAANVSDSVERMQYASVAGEEYLQGDRIETNLDDKVFFDFDRSTLDAEDKNLLEQYLPAIKNAKIVRLEGHCDERGTREYNLALGERRALEVRDFLVIKGNIRKKNKGGKFR